METARELPLKTFYFSFGGSSAFRNHHVAITARSRERCRELMFEHFGRKWCGCYSGDKTIAELLSYAPTRLAHIIEHEGQQPETIA